MCFDRCHNWKTCVLWSALKIKNNVGGFPNSNVLLHQQRAITTTILIDNWIYWTIPDEHTKCLTLTCLPSNEAFKSHKLTDTKLHPTNSKINQLHINNVVESKRSVFPYKIDIIKSTAIHSCELFTHKAIVIFFISKAEYLHENEWNYNFFLYTCRGIFAYTFHSTPFKYKIKNLIIFSYCSK